MPLTRTVRTQVVQAGRPRAECGAQEGVIGRVAEPDVVNLKKGQ